MRTILLALTLLVGRAAYAQEKPRLPYYDWGACPFECCTYREWTARRAVIAHASRSRRAPWAFQVRKGEHVRGVTGVVITRQYGVTEIAKAMQLADADGGEPAPVSLHPGDVVYTLHYEGEGSDLFWYRGHRYSGEIAVPDDAYGKAPSSAEARVKSRPKTEWWVKIENRGGQVGWTDDTAAFDHMDACG